MKIKVSNFVVKYLADYKKVNKKIKKIDKDIILNVLTNFVTFKTIYLASRYDNNFLPDSYGYMLKDAFLYELSYDLNKIDYKDLNKRIKKTKNMEIEFKKLNNDTIEVIDEYILPFSNIDRLTYPVLYDMKDSILSDIEEIVERIEKNQDEKNYAELQRLKDAVDDIENLLVDDKEYDAIDIAYLAQKLNLKYDEE